VKVIWTDTAASDLEEIHNYISKDSPEAALRVTRAIYERIMRLKSPSFEEEVERMTRPSSC
jgi:plasmid stabilization system protein ParE